MLAELGLSVVGCGFIGVSVLATDLPHGLYDKSISRPLCMQYGLCFMSIQVNWLTQSGQFTHSHSSGTDQGKSVSQRPTS